MLSTAIIIFRETLEIAMILGVVLAATRGLAKRSAWVFGGLVAGAAGAGLVAFFAESISDALSGMGQEFFNAMILFTAAGVIGFTAIWLRKNARHMMMHLKQVGHDVTAGKMPLYSLSLIIGLAILREGSEIVLFIYGMVLSGQGTTSIVTGASIGFGLGIVVGVMLYYGLLKIPARHVLRITSWLLILLVAGLAAQGVEYLSAAGYFGGLSQQVWDTSWLLSQDSILGKSLHSLIGYTARPSTIQLITYLATLGGLLLAIRIVEREKTHALAAVAVPLALLLVALTAQPAFALDKIYSPVVNKGEVEIEYSGSHSFDAQHSKDNIQGHELEVEYGVTDYWMPGVSFQYEKQPDETAKITTFELESRFQFFPQGENWLDSGLLLAYGFSNLRHTDADTLEAKLLLQKDIGKFTSLANIGLERQVGDHASGGPGYAVLWNNRYRYSEYFQPGIELQSDLGDNRNLSHFKSQSHYVGPAVYGKIVPGLKYEAAWLAGVSDAASGSAARLLLEYEMFF